MITLFFISLIGLAVLFASVPVVLFSLMLETAAERGARPAKVERRAISILPERFALDVELRAAA